MRVLKDKNQVVGVGQRRREQPLQSKKGSFSENGNQFNVDAEGSGEGAVNNRS